MVVTMGSLASALGTWRRRGTTISASGPGHHPCRLVADVVGAQRSGPAGQLEEDLVWVLEVDGSDEDPGMDLVGDAPLAVVVIGDLGALHAGRHQPLPVLVDAVGVNGEGHVVHRADGAGQ